MQMPVQVMEAVREVELLRGNVHRGIHTLSSRCTDAYEQARAVCAQFFGTEPGHITFTSGTTDGINRVAAAFTDRPGAIVVTELERPIYARSRHNNHSPTLLDSLTYGRLPALRPPAPESPGYEPSE